MDFGSNYILQEEEEEEMEEEEEEELPYWSNSGYQQSGSHGATGYVDFECEIMDFGEIVEDSKSPKEKGGKVKPKVNTNTIQLKMTSLKEEPDITLPMTSLATCGNHKCEAAFSHLDKDINKEDKVWTCKFCDFQNPRDGTEGMGVKDAPDSEDILYTDDPNCPPKMDIKKEDTKIIIAVDMSSSMRESVKVTPSKMTDTLKKIVGAEMKPHDESDHPVTRLEIVKATLIDAIREMKNDPAMSKKRVGLLAFCEKIHIYGDGSGDITTVSDESTLTNYSELFKLGHKNADLGYIEDTAEALEEKIKGLCDDGRTALGPAMVIAQGMASFSGGAAKVFVFTDGYANVGLGSMENTSAKSINDFYSEVISTGKSWKISVSLISFDDCGLDTMLGRVPEETGGLLDRIKPTEMSTCLREELSTDIIATNVAIYFTVHKDMYVKLQSHEHVKKSKFSHFIGNVRPNKSIPFNFTFRSCEEQKSNKVVEKPTTQGNIEGKAPLLAIMPGKCVDSDTESKEFPFQVQIVYTDLNGVKAQRVWTKTKPITKERQKAEQTMKHTVVVKNFIQTSATELCDAKGEKKVRDLADKILSELQEHMKEQTENALADFEKVVRSIKDAGAISEKNRAKLSNFAHDSKNVSHGH